MEKTTKNIWVVIEQGVGTIHKAFENEEQGKLYVEILKMNYDLDCFELQEIELIPNLLKL